MYIWATVDLFCPIATYTHNVPVPFWLIIASIAIAVLPVCLSPIINSLWALPIGNIPSIDLIPVCNGSLTGFLAIIPDACLSIGIYLSAVISPFPSIGDPKASTTLPNNSFPAGTSATFPVPLTVLPSFIPLLSPKITAPILFSSKFNAIPTTPFSNVTNSPDIALLNP